MTNNKKSVYFNISGDEGMFRVDKRATLYWEHCTTAEVKSFIAGIVKECKKMKNKQVMLDFTELVGFDHHYKYRYIINANWSGIEMEIRKNVNGSFPSVDPYKFVEEKDLYKYLTKHLTEQVNITLDDVPEDKCWYGKKLDGSLENERPEYVELLAR